MRESVIYQDIIERGVGKGRGQEALSYTIRLINRRFGEIDTQLQTRISTLSVVQLENLGEALVMDFSDVSDLVAWLDNQQE